MTRPQALDLFCGAGGASMGLHRAGFDVTGVDIRPQRYPFRFVQANALDPPFDLSRFDLIWASPPCQGYMRSGQVPKDGRYLKLIGLVRDLLIRAGVRFVIENVPGAPLRADLILCGTMFGLGIQRHRVFEGCPSLPPFVPATCNHGTKICGVYGNPRGQLGPWRHRINKGWTLKDDKPTWSREMGIDWMSLRELTQSIPPAYSEYIGRAILDSMQQESAA